MSDDTTTKPPVLQASPKTTEQKLPSCAPLNAMALPLQESIEGKKKIAAELYQRFHAMKTYGKEPESLDSIVSVFNRDLAEYPAEKIMKAISTHARRSDEFPTVADIAGLIQRNGRPPLKESDIIAIRKKEWEDRTDAELQMLSDWDEQQQTGWDDYQPDPQRAERHREENNRLREEVEFWKKEAERLGKLLADAKRQAPESKITLDDKIQNTVNWMKETGASQFDIEQFIAIQQAA